MRRPGATLSTWWLSTGPTARRGRPAVGSSTASSKHRRRPSNVNCLDRGRFPLPPRLRVDGRRSGCWHRKQSKHVNSKLACDLAALRRWWAVGDSDCPSDSGSDKTQINLAGYAPPQPEPQRRSASYPGSHSKILACRHLMAYQVLGLMDGSESSALGIAGADFLHGSGGAPWLPARFHFPLSLHSPIHRTLRIARPDQTPLGESQVRSFRTAAWAALRSNALTFL